MTVAKYFTMSMAVVAVTFTAWAMTRADLGREPAQKITRESVDRLLREVEALHAGYQGVPAESLLPERKLAYLLRESAEIRSLTTLGAEADVRDHPVLLGEIHLHATAMKNLLEEARAKSKK